MLLADAQTLAFELMAKHGLAGPGCSCLGGSGSTHASKRFGCCKHAGRIISLSAALVERNSLADVEDTIKHEIAHALVGYRKGDHHGFEWKQMCRVTGAKPERCYDSKEVNTVEGDWSAECPGCHHTYYKHRQPKPHKKFACLSCCKAHNRGRFTEDYLLVYRHKNAPKWGVSIGTPAGFVSMVAPIFSACGMCLCDQWRPSKRKETKNGNRKVD